MIKRISNSHYSEGTDNFRKDNMWEFTSSMYKIVTKNTGNDIIIFVMDNINFEIFAKIDSFYDQSYNDIQRICL